MVLIIRSRSDGLAGVPKPAFGRRGFNIDKTMKPETDIFTVPAPTSSFARLWQSDFRRSLAMMQCKAQGRADKLRKEAATDTLHKREYVETADCLQALANTLGSVVEAMVR